MAQIPNVHGSILQGEQYGTYDQGGFTSGTGENSNTTGGQASFFSGYQPLVLKFYQSNVFSVDTVESDRSITPGGRTLAIRTIATFGSILMVDRANDNDYLTVIADAASFNSGSTMNEDDSSFGALLAALDDSVNFSGSFSYAVGLNANGTWDF
jgi:hypothetical protein